MDKTSGTKEKLLEEISSLKQRIKELEQPEAQYKLIKEEIRTDIAKRKEAESQKDAALEALMESEQRYRSYIENAPNGVFIVDENGRYLQVNPSACRITGYSNAELLTMSIPDLVPPESREIAGKHFRKAVETGYAHGEFPFRHKHNQIRYWSVEAIRLSAKRFMGFVQDITERMQAEARTKVMLAALQESEASLAEAQRIARIGSWDWDMISNTVKWSKEMYRVFGISPDAFDGKPESLLKVIHPDDVDLFTNTMKSNLSKGDPTSLEFRVIHKSGSIHHIFAAGSVEINKDGRPIRNIGTAQDITERKHAEEELQESEYFLKTLLHSIPIPVFYKDREGRYLGFNKAFESFFGATKERLIGKTVFDINPTDLAEIYHAKDNELFESGGVQQYSSYVKNALGIMREVIFNKAIFTNSHGEINGQIGAILDITDRRQSEDALVESEENFRLLYETSPIGIELFDSSGRLVHANPACLVIFGLDSDDFAKGFDLFADPNVSDESKAALSRGETVRYQVKFDFEKVHAMSLYPTTRHGIIELDVIIQPISSGTGYQVLIQDITTRKRTEDEKAKLEAQLFQSQKMEAIGTLAGGIAHDFNNILAVIIGYTELARDRNQKENKEQYLQEALMGAERARNLIKQILTFSRQDDYEKKPMDMKPLLKEAVKFLRSSIPATIEINQHITDDSCNIMADATQMHQIIMNLCTNASHAMKETGGILNIELTNIELTKDEIPHHPDLQPGHYVKLTVEDTGYGINPDNIHKIFDPFFTTKSKNEGTGLGLSVVYGIVNGHGGAIDVYSEQEKKTAFHVYLPRIIQTETMLGDTNKPVIGGSERILFVDDEPALVDIGMRILFPLGYHVTGATSSKGALDIFSAAPQSFDLVITDMTLPKMTGIDLSRKILLIRPNIPIILCSGIKEPDTEVKAKSLGIKAYLTKPLMRRELAEAVRDVLGEKR